MEEDKRKGVRSMPKDSKWIMVSQHMAQEQQKQQSDNQGLHHSLHTAIPFHRSDASAKTGPEFFVQQLQDALQRQTGNSFVGPSATATVKQLIPLRVSFTSQPIAWTQQFIDLDGVGVLFDLLEAVLQKPLAKQ